MSIVKFAIFILLFVPVIALGQDTGPQGLVTCSGTDCDFCLFMEMFDVVVDWVIMISVLLLVLVLAYAGFGLVTSAGNQSAYENAKEYFINGMIGLVLLMAAWTIVDTVLKTLTGSDYGVWEPVECGEMYDPVPVVSDREGIDLNDIRRTLTDLGFNFDGEVGELNETTDCDFEYVLGGNIYNCQEQVNRCIRGGYDADVHDNQVTCISRGSVFRPAETPISCTGGSAFRGVPADCSGAQDACRVLGGRWTPPSDPFSNTGGFCTVSSPVGDPPTGPVTGCSGSACVRMDVPCTNGCSIASSIVNRMNRFHADVVAFGVTGSRVTEAMPPSRVHKSQCHMNGTCVDYSKAGGMNAQEVLAVIRAARQNGLRPVYEVVTSAQRAELVAGGVSPNDILVLGNWITAPHFSIYAN